VHLLGEFRQRRYPQHVDHVLSCDLHRPLSFRLGAPHGLDCAEKVAEAGFVALVILRIGQPFLDWQADGLLLWQAGLGQGQLGTDVDFEFVQEGGAAAGVLRDFMRRLLRAGMNGGSPARNG
jgi:hypothetical protein